MYRWTSGLGLAILVQILVLSGCANKPNLVPEGYITMIEKAVGGGKQAKVVREKLAELDYPITVAVEQNDVDRATDITVLWTKEGETIWTKPFWSKVRWWRFSLVAQSGPVDSPALCYTQWQEVGSSDPTRVQPCNFVPKDYIGKPLVGMLDYSFEDKKPNDDDYGSPDVSRLYYIVLK